MLSLLKKLFKKKTKKFTQQDLDNLNQELLKRNEALSKKLSQAYYN